MYIFELMFLFLFLGIYPGGEELLDHMTHLFLVFFFNLFFDFFFFN